MDLNQMNSTLRSLHAQIADLHKYRVQAERDANALLMYSIDREIRDLQHDVRKLQREIDAMSSREVKL